MRMLERKEIDWASFAKEPYRNKDPLQKKSHESLVRNTSWRLRLFAAASPHENASNKNHCKHLRACVCIVCMHVDMSIYAYVAVHILIIMFCRILSLHVFVIDLPVAAVCCSVCCSVLQCALQSAAVHIEVVVHFDSVLQVPTGSGHSSLCAIGTG